MRNRVRSLENTIQRSMDEHRFPSAQYAIAKDNEVIAAGAFGEADEASQFSIMSATKPVFASLVLKLIGDRKLTLATRVVDLWPEFGANGKDAITVEHLLTFTAGIPEWWPSTPVAADRQLRNAEAEALELSWAPGSAGSYHPVSAHWVLAELVARVTGTDYRTALREEVLDPLGLPRLELGVPAERRTRPVPFVKIGEPRPEQALAFSGVRTTVEEMDAGDDVALLHANDPATIAVGVPGAGGISDAASLALFHQNLLHDPQGLWDPVLRKSASSEPRNRFEEPMYHGARWNRSIGCLIITRPEPSRIVVPQLGVDRSARMHGEVVSDGTFGQGGAGGQIAVTDPRRGITFCYLSKRLPPRSGGGPGAGSGIDRRGDAHSRSGMSSTIWNPTCVLRRF